MICVVWQDDGVGSDDVAWGKDGGSFFWVGGGSGRVYDDAYGGGHF